MGTYELLRSLAGIALAAVAVVVVKVVVVVLLRLVGVVVAKSGGEVVVGHSSSWHFLVQVIIYHFHWHAQHKVLVNFMYHFLLQAQHILQLGKVVLQETSPFLIASAPGDYEIKHLRRG